MISILLALAAAQAAPQQGDPLFKNCIALVKTGPARALSTANEWRIKGGGLGARQCIGLAYAALERWAPAAEAFEQAAKDAQSAGDARQFDFRVQAGNAWLAADEAAKARTAFDAALAAPQLTPELRGEIHLDRGRAGVALGELGGARNDINKGLELVPGDPFAWYLSAALALREGNMAKANSDIAQAIALAPEEPDILLQAGNIAGTSGDVDAARAYYARALKIAPTSDAGKSARAALADGAAR